MTVSKAQSFGNVLSLVVPKLGQPGALFAFVKFATIEEAQACKKAMSTRTFDGKPVLTKVHIVLPRCVHDVLLSPHFIYLQFHVWHSCIAVFPSFTTRQNLMLGSLMLALTISKSAD